MNFYRPMPWIAAAVLSFATAASADVIKVAHADNQAHPKHQAFVRFAADGASCLVPQDRI